MSVCFKFYNFIDLNVKYMIDDVVGFFIGEVIVELLDILRGIDWKIDVCVMFGGIEIKVIVIDKISGNMVMVYLDFLCNKF